MKKMKRVATMVLSLVMVITMLGGCNSSSSTSTEVTVTNRPTETPTATEEVKPTEEIKPTETETTTVTEEPTETAEPQSDEVVNFFFTIAGKPDIREVDPAELQEYDVFKKFYFLNGPLEVTEAGITMEMDDFTDYGHEFELSSVDGDYKAVVEMYVYELDMGDPNQPNQVRTYIIIPGEDSNGIGIFIPLMYNKTKGCLVGYSFSRRENTYSFIEVYLNPDSPTGLKFVTVDPVLYGF